MGYFTPDSLVIIHDRGHERCIVLWLSQVELQHTALDELYTNSQEIGNNGIEIHLIIKFLGRCEIIHVNTGKSRIKLRRKKMSSPLITN